MFTIKIYLNNKLNRVLTYNNKRSAIEKYYKLTVASELYTLSTGNSTKVELYENNESIRCIETEY